MRIHESSLSTSLGKTAEYTIYRSIYFLDILFSRFPVECLVAKFSRIIYCKMDHQRYTEGVSASSHWHLVSRPTKHLGSLAESRVVGYCQKVDR